MWNIMMLLDLFHLNVPNASELGETTTVTSCEGSYFALLEIKYRMDCDSGPAESVKMRNSILSALVFSCLRLA
jgi:hypothetical protein